MSDYNPNHVHTKVWAIVGQKAIITNSSNQILVLQRSEKSGNGGKWALAGGALENGEDPAQGITREIQEETNLLVSDLKTFHAFSQINKNNDFVVIIAYTCQATTESVTLNWEHDQYQWVSVEEALKLDLSEHARKLIFEFAKISTAANS